MRGAEILSRAQVVIYDSLVNPGLLRLAPASAELIHAGKRGGAHKELAQADINAMLIAYARKGMAVVRLKGGDPFIFGRGGEEAEASRRRPASSSRWCRASPRRSRCRRSREFR